MAHPQDAVRQVKFTSGRPETLCGAGSTLRETEYLRSLLPIMFSDLGVRSLLDAPCGDFNWMAQVDLTGIDYIGADYSDDNLKAARQRADRDFRRLDIVTDDLPDADAMLCRDFHQHIPNAMVISALRNFVASGIRWLIATTHDNPVNEDIEKPGMFRRINLEVGPFCLPATRTLIADPPGSGHYLAVWDREAVFGSLL